MADSREYALMLGETAVRLRVTANEPTGIVLLNLHENEQTSVRAARRVLPEYGGTLVEVLHGGDRHITFELEGRSYQVDPNRIFTKLGTLMTLIGLNNIVPGETLQTCVNAFAGELLSLVARETKPDRVIGLHNNTDDDVPGGGHYSARSYLPGASMIAAAQAIALNYYEDQDDFLFCTTRQLFQAAILQGYNAVLQSTEECPDDGSMSVHCANAGMPYVNSECQYDHEEKQAGMLAFVLREWRR